VTAYPTELRRVLESRSIKKVGVGLAKDINVLWDDLRSDMKHLVDVGLMAKLALAEKYGKSPYTNLGLNTSVEDILGYTISKELTTSDWAADVLSDEQIRCKYSPNNEPLPLSIPSSDRCRTGRNSLVATPRSSGGCPGAQEPRNSRQHTMRVVHIQLEDGGSGANEKSDRRLRDSMENGRLHLVHQR